MIVKGIVLIILVFAAFIFLGLKISESVNSSSIRLFFFSLYFMTIFSIFNLCLTVYFFIKLKDLKGPQGKKGLQGKQGDKGVHGSCGVGEELRMNYIRSLEMHLDKIDDDKITVNVNNNPIEVNKKCIIISEIKKNNKDDIQNIKKLMKFCKDYNDSASGNQITITITDGAISKFE